MIGAFLVALLVGSAGCGGGNSSKPAYPDALVPEEDAAITGTAGATGSGDSGGANGSGGVFGPGGPTGGGGAASGGRPGSGGAVATGGRADTAGTVGTGGGSPATGGSANTGGRAQTGGATATGGTVAPGTGGAGAGGATCAAVGQPCPADLNCCAGSTCAVIGTALLCSANCRIAADCGGGCCRAYTGSAQLACAPATECATYEGTVLAADSVSNKLLIQTSTGPAFFTETGLNCFGFTAGTKVSFSSSPGGCFTNQITSAASSSACAVKCDGSSFYTGVVLSADFSKFVISTLFGNQMFDAQTICSGILTGDNVVFENSTGACVTNSFADTQSGQFCNVWCR